MKKFMGIIVIICVLLGMNWEVGFSQENEKETESKLNTIFKPYHDLFTEVLIDSYNKCYEKTEHRNEEKLKKNDVEYIFQKITSEFFSKWSYMQYALLLSKINHLFIEKTDIKTKERELVSAFSEILGGIFLQEHSENGQIFIPENLLDILTHLLSMGWSTKKHDGALVAISKKKVGYEITVYTILEAKLGTDLYNPEQSEKVKKRWTEKGKGIFLGDYLISNGQVKFDVKIYKQNVPDPNIGNNNITIPNFITLYTLKDMMDKLVDITDDIFSSDLSLKKITNRSSIVKKTFTDKNIEEDRRIFNLISSKILKNFTNEALRNINSDFIDEILVKLKEYMRTHNDKLPSILSSELEDINLAMALNLIYRNEVLFSIFKDKINAMFSDEDIRQYVLEDIKNSFSWYINEDNEDDGIPVLLKRISKKEEYSLLKKPVEELYSCLTNLKIDELDKLKKIILNIKDIIAGIEKDEDIQSLVYILNIIEQNIQNTNVTELSKIKEAEKIKAIKRGISSDVFTSSITFDEVSINTQKTIDALVEILGESERVRITQAIQGLTSVYDTIIETLVLLLGEANRNSIEQALQECISIYDTTKIRDFSAEIIKKYKALLDFLNRYSNPKTIINGSLQSFDNLVNFIRISPELLIEIHLGKVICDKPTIDRSDFISNYYNYTDNFPNIEKVKCKNCPQIFSQPVSTTTTVNNTP